MTFKRNGASDKLLFRVVHYNLDSVLLINARNLLETLHTCM